MSKKMLLLLILITPSILIGMEKEGQKKPASTPAPIKEEPKRKLSASKVTEKSQKSPYMALIAEKLQSMSIRAEWVGYLD